MSVTEVARLAAKGRGRRQLLQGSDRRLELGGALARQDANDVGEDRHMQPDALEYSKFTAERRCLASNAKSAGVRHSKSQIRTASTNRADPTVRVHEAKAPILSLRRSHEGLQTPMPVTFGVRVSRRRHAETDARQCHAQNTMSACGVMHVPAHFGSPLERIETAARVRCHATAPLRAQRGRVRSETASACAVPLGICVGGEGDGADLRAHTTRSSRSRLQQAKRRMLA
eukprot:6053993-Pleurochrysis_carterae.AAC.2